MDNIPPVEESRNYIEKEHYKHTTEWWKKQCDGLQETIDKFKKDNRGLIKKNTELIWGIRNIEDDFRNYDRKWRNSFLYRLYKRFNRDEIKELLKK
jgi:predicted RNase H-like nuclease (RuvC/YqgF family)